MNQKTESVSPEKRTARRTQVHVLTGDHKIAAEFEYQMTSLGCSSQRFSDLVEYKAVLKKLAPDSPAVLFVLLSNHTDYREYLDQIQELLTFDFYIPIIVIGYRDDFEIRLNALRAGAIRYFRHPVSDNKLQEILVDLAVKQPKRPYRALLVDDESITIDIHAHILREAGMEVSTLSNPMEVLNTIARVGPEVIVLDVYMPEVSGLEIAAILKDNEEYRDIPILFLSSESDILTELHALSLGGDDYYVKPVEPNRFVNGVTVRAKRCRRNSVARQLLHKALYEREREHLALNNHALVSVTDCNGSILLANKKFSEVSGYSADELIGNSHRILKSGVHTKVFYTKIWASITKGETWHGEICNRAKDGSLYWVESTITPLLSDDGKPYQYISIVTDITALKVAETKFKNARDQAEKANKAKSEFLANMSHELRTPLNAIVGFSQLLDSSDDLTQENRDDVKEILKASKHLMGLINDVLDLSKIEAGKLQVSIENIIIMPIIRECITMIMPMALKRKILLDCEGYEELCIKCDRGRLKQVMLNLLSNAVKYNVEHGSVKILFDCVKSGYLRIMIKDTGIGISEEDLPSIFNPFSRLEYQYSEIEGTGIGLALTRQLVEQMGGFVGVESKLNSGSTFWIDLPTSIESSVLEDEFNMHRSVDDINMSDNDLPKKHVVYIDDYVTNLKLIESIFERMPDFELTTFQDPVKGLDFVRKNIPDLLLLDIHMPIMNGYDVLRALKADENCKSIPVVAVSANALLQDIEEGLGEGFTEYITKPFDVKKLQLIVRDILEPDASN